MADTIVVQPRMLPWEPSDRDTTLVSVLMRWNVPLVGIIDQAGAEFLFESISGSPEGISLWAYVRIEEAERAALTEAASDSEALAAEMAKVFGSGRPLALAAAIEPLGVIAHRNVLNHMPEEFDEVVRELLTAIEGELSEVLAATRAMRGDFALTA